MMSAANEPSGRSPGFDPQAPHHQRPGQAQVLRRDPAEGGILSDGEGTGSAACLLRHFAMGHEIYSVRGSKYFVAYVCFLAVSYVDFLLNIFKSGLMASVP